MSNLCYSRRDPQFYEQLNTDSKKNLNAEKPRQQTNDGRLYNFTAFTQNGTNLNMEKQIQKTEQEEFDNDHLKTVSTIDKTSAKPTKYSSGIKPTKQTKLFDRHNEVTNFRFIVMRFHWTNSTLAFSVMQRGE